MKNATLRLLSAGVLALGLAAACLMLVLPGCTGGTYESDTADNGSSAQNEQPPAADDQVVSTAMVAYADGNQVLLVDQETGTPYFPTLTDDAIIGLDGDDIDPDELVAGNIVEVTGNGIMLESYPGQYPGITKIQVVEQGTPADADQYADIVEQVIVVADPTQVPTGYVEYTTDLAQTSLMLNAYSYDWIVPGDGSSNQNLELDGDFAAANGMLNSDISDARIAGSLQATAGFSMAPTNVDVERTPLVDGNTVNPAAEDEPVPVTLQQDGTATFTIEPNYVYEIDVDFAQGEASYAFYTLS